MTILIVYATYSSGTETATHVAKDFLTQAGHTVTIKKAVDSYPEELTTHDLVILASPSWWVNDKDGQPHIQMGEFLSRSVGTMLTNKRFAIFGLGDSTYAHFCGAVGELETFVKQRDGSLLQDSLRIDGFYFNEEKNTQLLKNWLTKLQTNL